MKNKQIFKKLTSARSEMANLKQRIDDIENRSRKVLSDSVKGSSNEFPYVEHNCIISGVKMQPKILKKLKRMYKESERKLGKLIVELEYTLKYVEDEEIRELLRMKYEDNLSWNRIAFKKDTTADAIRMKIKRYFEKN